VNDFFKAFSFGTSNKCFSNFFSHALLLFDMSNGRHGNDAYAFWDEQQFFDFIFVVSSYPAGS